MHLKTTILRVYCSHLGTAESLGKRIQGFARKQRAALEKQLI